MTDPGSAISISLEDIESRIRAIAARRQTLPAPGAVRQTLGPSDGSSAAFAERLDAAALVLEDFTRLLGAQVKEFERLLAVTGEELVAEDESVADDVRLMNRMADAVAVPGKARTAPSPGSAGSSAPAGTSDGDAAVTLG